MTSEELLELGKRFRVLGDRLIVKRVQYEHPLLAVVGVELQKGLVIAGGPGRRMRRKTAFKQHAMAGGETLYFEDGEETGKIRPMRVKVGDVVEFSPRGQFAFTFEGEDLLVVKEQACYGLVSADPSAGLLFQQSAGYDRNGNFLSGAEQWQR